MWSPDLSVLRVGLSQRQLSMGRVAWLGWGRVQALEPLACPASTEGEPAWRAAVDRLAQWLDGQKASAGAVQIVLSGRLVRWQVLPWREELSSGDAFAAYAALRFRETYGKLAQDWTLLPANLAPGQAVPVAAVDTALLEALQAVCQSHALRLQGVAAYFSQAFDRWHTALKGNSLWFATVEPDVLTLGLVKDGQWHALQSQRIAGDWKNALPPLLEQMAWACDVAVTEPPLYLAGAVPAPDGSHLDHAAGALPFTWLQPRPAAQQPAQGLRLALGC